MDFVVRELILETTRRCNLRCGHCMRGESQNIDLNKEIVDIILNNNHISCINTLLFSGGEPTLNSDIIIYTINKIISENLNVCELVMVTNGQIFNRELVETFNRFNEYRNKRFLIHVNEVTNDEEIKKYLIEGNTDNHVRITFSSDQFHKPINPDVEKLYLKYSKGLRITKTHPLKESEIYKTGFAPIGKSFNYKLDQLRYYENEGKYFVMDNLYITANGYITTEGMGEYTDMDCINMGHVSAKTIREILVEYGTPIFGTEAINSGNVLKKIL